MFVVEGVVMKQESKEQRVFETIKRDLTEEDLFRKLRKEIQSIREFYIDAEKQLKLKKMNRIRRFFYIIWWTLKGMFFKLSPLRRILLLIAFIIPFTSFSQEIGNETKLVFDNQLISTLLILFVLMLELKDKLIAHEELDAARKVQLALQPNSQPEINGWDIFLFSKPANNVGGDLIDFIKVGSDSLYGITIADVAGKGLKSALLAAKLQTLIHISMSDDEKINERIKRLNLFFYKETLRSIFASLIFIQIRSDDSKIQFVNAGHFPPVILKKNLDGSSELIEYQKGDSAIGLIEKNQFTVNEIDLKTNEIFLAYSDGLIEARNELNQFFGIERVKKILLKHSQLDSKNLCLKILVNLENFMGDAKQNDDISIVVIRKI